MKRCIFQAKVFPAIFLFFLAAVTLGLSYEPASPARSFWVPKDPPGAEYVLDAKISVEGGTASVVGKGTVVFVNTSSRPLSVLALDWAVTPNQRLELSADGRPVRFLNEAMGLAQATPLLFELAAPVRPGGKIRLDVRFTHGDGLRDAQVHLQAWYPRLWWDGIPVRDWFKVKMDLPQGYVAAVSGRLDPKSGFYENDSVTTRFAVFLSSAMKADEVESEGVLIRALSTEKGRDCARLCLNAAADIIKFYKTWLGVFPRKSLCIIPGGPQPWGGYPYASGIVVIHGQETFDPKKGEKDVNWWTWITAHEIGHQYWGEFVLPDDVRGNYTDSWLMIGMGICADKAYMLGRGYGWQQHRGFIDGYLQGVRAKNDTTMDAPPSLARTQKFDTNNVVIHGKGFAVLSALETVIGSETFEKIYRRTLMSFAGKRLGWRDLRRLCEEETGGDLGWFFEDWVRSTKVLECRITSQTSEPKAGGGFRSEVRVEYGMDSLRMPVPVEAVFEDGTREQHWTDRFARTNTLRFESRAKLKEVRLDPEQRLALVKEPVPKSAADLEEAIDNLDWTGTGEAALEIYKRPEVSGIKDAHAWFKMGLLLFDGRHNRESLEAFRKCGELDRSGQNLFAAFVWMGNLADLLGDREKAVAYYREALKHDTGSSLQHDQYGLRINKAWVEDRLKAPFKWNR